MRLCVVIRVLITLTVALVNSAICQTNFLTLLTNGPTATRLNIVFLSEGYTASDLVHFPSDAQTMLNRMLSSPPLAEYSNYFNAFAISVPSNESGADHYTPSTILVDTFFNARYDTSGVQRLLTIDSVGRSRANSLLATYMPEYDLAAVVVNDIQYGGSGGSILVSSINSQSPEIATHEMGHTFANLGDEYSDAGSTPSERPNTTTETNLALIKWTLWIPDGTPIPTPDVSPYLNTIGLFRGAAYSTNYFRPKHNCKMRSLGVAFCEVCSETLIKTIYNMINMIEVSSPPTNVVLRLTNGLASTFTVSNLLPSTHSLRLQWFTNNVALTGATSAVLRLAGFDLPATGTNSIRIDVTDATPAVRTGPTNMLLDSLAWKATFVADNPPISASAGPGAIVLNWPTTAAGLQLEQALNLSAPLWTPMLLISNQTGVSIATTNTRSFFRLHRP